jgi:glycosyltransferase involved in cell wall biosynthesis
MPKLCIFVTHPVQYHVPLWRTLAAHPGLDVKVFYFNDQSVRGGRDEGFGINVKWDVDLLSGYQHEFLSRNIDSSSPLRMHIRGIRSLLRRERPDWAWVSGYTRVFEQQLAAIAPSMGIRLFMRGEFSDLAENRRSFLKRLARASYLRLFYSRISAFGYPGENGRDHLRAHGVPEHRMFFSPYSVDDELLARKKARYNRGSTRRELNIADDWFTFLISGKLIPRKDPHAVLRAIREMPARNRVGLIALGDGELRDSFVSEARALLGPRFLFPGFVNQSELSRYFVAADGLVMPSHHETWGLVVNEAMQHGLPVVVSDQTGCHRDLVLPGVTGWVYPRTAPEQLTTYMIRLAQDPDTARRMGAAAASHVRAYSVTNSARGVFEAIGIEPPPARSDADAVGVQT